MDRRRRCLVLRGDPVTTGRRALALCEALDDASVLWVGGEASARFVDVKPGAAKKKLGQSFDAVVLDLHRGIDAEVLGQCQGFVWAGGALILRMPPEGAPPTLGREKLACFPYTPEQVTTRFWERFERCLARSDAVQRPARPLAPAARDVRGTEEQRRVVERLSSALRAPTPSATALLSDRGRGKSSALGLALRAAMEAGVARVAISGPSVAACAEVFRFANASPEAPLDAGARFVSPPELARSDATYDVVVIDEAAQLPVPLLQRIVRRHPRARLAFATTARGYEGTGRGFVLRFLEWLESEPRPLTTLSLSHPIRWDPLDPLERLVFDALALDAQPADEEALRPFDPAEVRAAELDRDELAHDEARLREVFGLLVHAHYRTTPSDLHRLLDAPNLRVHALSFRGRVVAATLVALEGAMPEALCERLARGEERVRGHALPDTLISHAGKIEAGQLSMVRSVRIASHAALRRHGLATALVDHVHASYDPDLFGTLFGATVELLRFRRAVGYRLVRVGFSRGSRTGEPAAVMVRPVSTRATELTEALRAELARDLALTVDLLNADGELELDPDLLDALRDDLPEPAALTDAQRRDAVASYAFGPRPYEAAAFAITRFVEEHAAALDGLARSDRALIEGRVLRRDPWASVAAAAGFDTVHAAMRAMRRALRGFALDVDPSLSVYAPRRGRRTKDEGR